VSERETLSFAFPWFAYLHSPRFWHKLEAQFGAQRHNEFVTLFLVVGGGARLPRRRRLFNAVGMLSGKVQVLVSEGA
jgi:hypothetical protein